MLDLVADWAAFIAADDVEAAYERLRAGERTGRPLGDAGTIDRLEAAAEVPDLSTADGSRSRTRVSVLETNAAVALSLEDVETDRLAREVAKLTGETLTEAVRRALAERLERERRRRGRTKGLAERLDEIALHCASLPDHDPRTPEEIVGYANPPSRWRLICSTA